MKQFTITTDQSDTLLNARHILQNLRHFPPEQVLKVDAIKTIKEAVTIATRIIQNQAPQLMQGEISIQVTDLSADTIFNNRATLIARMNLFFKD